MKRIITAILSILLLVTSCKEGGKAADPMGENGRTQRTESLLENLDSLREIGYLFGHQDATVYGIGWVGDSARSDVKTVCGDFPGMVGFDLGHIELGDSLNLDGVPFDRIRKEIIAQYDRSGVVTLSWHLDNPLTKGSSWVKPDSITADEKQTVASILEGKKDMGIVFYEWMDRVADFMLSLETPYGVKVPVIFRPFHENTGSWFWWGADCCTPEQYKELWSMLYSHFKTRHVTNVIWAYSPGTECGGDAKRYLERYPGDDMVDVVGLDAYCFAADESDTLSINAFADNLDKHLSMLCKIADEHKKIPALTETGFEGIKTENWWTQTLMPVLNKYPVSYVLLWRNAHDKDGHYFVPFIGQKSVSDFILFYDDPKTLFLHDFNGLYLKREKTEEK